MCTQGQDVPLGSQRIRGAGRAGCDATVTKLLKVSCIHGKSPVLVRDRVTMPQVGTMWGARVLVAVCSLQYCLSAGVLHGNPCMLRFSYSGEPAICQLAKKPSFLGSLHQSSVQHQLLTFDGVCCSVVKELEMPGHMRAEARRSVCTQTDTWCRWSSFCWHGPGAGEPQILQRGFIEKLISGTCGCISEKQAVVSWLNCGRHQM